MEYVAPSSLSTNKACLLELLEEVEEELALWKREAQSRWKNGKVIDRHGTQLETLVRSHLNTLRVERELFSKLSQSESASQAEVDEGTTTATTIDTDESASGAVDVIVDTTTPTDHRGQEEKSTKSRKRSREEARLADFNRPGTKYVYPEPRKISGIANKSHSKPKEIVKKLLVDLEKEAQRHGPVWLAEMHKKSRAAKDDDGPSSIVSVDRISKAYYRAHLASKFVDEKLSGFLPRGLRVKRAALQKAIAFFSTTSETICYTHHDRDYSVLIVLQGTKEILFAKPGMLKALVKQGEIETNSASCIYEGIEPFMNKQEFLDEGWEYERFDANDAWVLPRDWIHSIKSHPGTVAVSIQIELDESVTWDDVPGLKRGRIDETEPSRPNSPNEAKTDVDSSCRQRLRRRRRVDYLALSGQQTKPTGDDHDCEAPDSETRCESPCQPRITQDTRPSRGNSARMSSCDIRCQVCGKFLAQSELVWVLLRKEWWRSAERIPTNNPFCVICRECLPVEGRRTLEISGERSCLPEFVTEMVEDLKNSCIYELTTKTTLLRHLRDQSKEQTASNQGRSSTGSSSKVDDERLVIPASNNTASPLPINRSGRPAISAQKERDQTEDLCTPMPMHIGVTLSYPQEQEPSTEDDVETKMTNETSGPPQGQEHGGDTMSQTESTDNQETWDAVYKRLRAFHGREGHCNVPQPYRDDPELARFVEQHRSESIKIEPRKKLKLDALQFDFERTPSSVLDDCARDSAKEQYVGNGTGPLTKYVSPTLSTRRKEQSETRTTSDEDTSSSPGDNGSPLLLHHKDRGAVQEPASSGGHAIMSTDTEVSDSSRRIDRRSRLSRNPATSECQSPSSRQLRKRGHGLRCGYPRSKDGICGKCFVDGELFWLLRRRDWYEEGVRGECVVVPKDNPLHLICRDCLPVRGRASISIVEPVVPQVVKEHTMHLKDKFSFFIASKTDAIKHLNEQPDVSSTASIERQSYVPPVRRKPRKRGHGVRCGSAPRDQQSPTYPSQRQLRKRGHGLRCGYPKGRDGTCGRCMVDDELMWVLMRHDWYEEGVRGKCVVVPKDNPLYLICRDCLPVQGEASLDVDEPAVPKIMRKRIMHLKDDFSYVLASKTDVMRCLREQPGP